MCSSDEHHWQKNLSWICYLTPWLFPFMLQRLSSLHLVAPQGHFLLLLVKIQVINPFDCLTPIHMWITLIVSLCTAVAPRVNDAFSDTFLRSRSKHWSKFILCLFFSGATHVLVFGVVGFSGEMVEQSISPRVKGEQRAGNPTIPGKINPHSPSTLSHSAHVHHLPLKLWLETITSCFTVTPCLHPFSQES